MKKVIIIVRTSTVRQEIDSQRDEVINYALSDGYKLEELEVIGDAGSSAIKLDERYMENINKVYSTIESTPSIECVYAWAIDRIGRREELLMNFKNFLISKGINLKIKNPSIHLLESDGRVNGGAELAFSLFATMAKQEMEQKKERFKRAKSRNTREGKFNGGPETRYGYTVENGFFAICQEEAEIVRLMFEEYATGNYSMQKLATELNNRGLRHRERKFNVAFIHYVLEDETYIGEGNKAAIIDKELFDKAKYIRENQTSTLLSKESRTIHLATKLLKCRECGSNYVANFDRYCCYKHRFGKRFDDVCNNELCIRINILDPLIWGIAKEKHQQYLSVVDESKVEDLRKDTIVLQQKIYECGKKIEALEGRRKRIITLYSNGDTTDEEYNNQRNKLNIDLRTYKEDMIRFSKKVEMNKDIEYKLLHPEENISLDIESVEEQKKIVNQHIKSIYLDNITFKGKPAVLITVNDEIKILYDPRSKRKQDCNIYFWENEQWVGKFRFTNK